MYSSFVNITIRKYGNFCIQKMTLLHDEGQGEVVALPRMREANQINCKIFCFKKGLHILMAWGSGKPVLIILGLSFGKNVFSSPAHIGLSRILEVLN